MLVLTRKLQEKIHIGDNVTVTIVRIQGSTVRVGIEAPQDVRVIRGEISECEQPLAAPATVANAEDASSGDGVSGGESDVSHRMVPRLSGGALAGRGRLRIPSRKMHEAEKAPLHAI